MKTPRSWIAGALLALAAGCGGGTNHTVMVVSVASDLSIGGELDTVNLVVADGELSYPFALGSGQGKVALPIRVALVPGGKNDRQFRVEAIGMLGGENIVTQSATVSFVSGTAQQLSLFLARSCVRFPMCNDGFTCQNGACVDEATAGTRGMYNGDAGGMTPVDGGSGGRIDAGDAGGIGGTTGSGGTNGSGGSSGSGGINGTGGTPGIGGGGGSGGLIGTGGTGTGGFGIGGAGAGIGSGGTGAGGIIGTGGLGAGSGGSGAGGAVTGIGGMGGFGAGTGAGGFTATGLGGAGGTFGTGGFKVGGLGGGIIDPGLGGSAALSSGLPLFEDDFESGFADTWSATNPDDWQVVSGSGSDTSAVYQRSGAFTPGNVSIAGDPSWDDVVVEAKINVSAFAGTSASQLGGICARVSLPGDYYLLALRADGRIDLRRVSRYAETILASTSTAVVTADTWYTLRLSAVGSNLSAYLNGRLVLTAADATYPSGEIGLQTDSAVAQFDDVTVTTP